MGKVYNEIAGRNLDRLAGLSDGIFAFAMTLLALDLRPPDFPVVHSEAELWSAVSTQMLPRLIPYLMSFMTLGIFWVGQQTQLNVLSRTDRNLTWLHIAVLLTITLLPLTTWLLASHPAYRVALAAYWINILLYGITVYAAWEYAVRAQLVAPEMPAAMLVAVPRRIIAAQSLYAAGAALCLINTYVSIAFIMLVQLNYVLAPRLRWLYRL